MPLRISDFPFRTAASFPDRAAAILGEKRLSYGALAAKLGCPRAVRAVGTANGANPVSVVVPCHRVIGSDGSLTGYGGGLPRKRWLLDHEARYTRDDLFSKKASI